MAKPITSVKTPVPTEEEQRKQALEQLSADVAESGEPLHAALALLRELNDGGVLEAALAMLRAKEKIAEIALGQASRKPVTNTINHVMGAAGAMSELDPELTKKLLGSIVSGMEHAEEQLQAERRIGLWDLMKALSDPDINRAVGFGLHFLKGMGQSLGK
ncbi:DUF1641 domain-containing protein [Paenibacillus humicola]|uniref:DUF1641 domain-containing protein n=1 Tax=Paenibacillus humicola TaxID=3110540 RepID=UPI00237A37B3|nr:DUF1641 domain-containing protein [Paenibacillus humicola]